MDNKFKEDLELDSDDVEVDCAMIESVHPIPPTDLSKELPTKDIRYTSIESGYGSVTSYNSACDSGLIDGFEKLKLAQINETGPCDLYDKPTIVEPKVGPVLPVPVPDNEHEDLLLEIFKPDKDGDS